MKELPHIRVYRLNSKAELPVVSLNIKNMDPGKVALALAEKKDICVRAGLHCAPFAHDTIGTKAYGTVRFSFGPFNQKEEVDEVFWVEIGELEKILQDPVAKYCVYIEEIQGIQKYL